MYRIDEYITTYKSHKADFQGVTKRIIRKELSTNPITIERLKCDIITVHDKVVSYIASFFNKLNKEHRLIFRKELVYIRDRTIECFGRLSINIKVSTSLLRKLNNEPTNRPDSPEEFEFHGFENWDGDNMATNLTTPEFLRLAAQTINRNYSGEPLALNAFINSIDLLTELATTEQLREIFFKFIKAKLEGKALECIPTEASSVQEIKSALLTRIKPDSSKVVAGRMLALRPDKTKLVDFTKQAEDLAEALQRSLIIEGISQEKAREMTVDKAVELCRNASSSNLVKSVLASTKFEDPKEVLAKFVTETNTDTQERQVLAFRQHKRGNFNSRGNFNRGRGYRHNSFNGHNNNNNNNAYRNQSSGRGRGTGGSRRNDRTYRQFPEHNVRVAENYSGPSTAQSWRAASAAVTPQAQQNSFQVPYQQN